MSKQTLYHWIHESEHLAITEVKYFAGTQINAEEKKTSKSWWFIDITILNETKRNKTKPIQTCLSMYKMHGNSLPWNSYCYLILLIVGLIEQNDINTTLETCAQNHVITVQNISEWGFASIFLSKFQQKEKVKNCPKTKNLYFVKSNTNNNNKSRIDAHDFDLSRRCTNMWQEEWSKKRMCAQYWLHITAEE